MNITATLLAQIAAFVALIWFVNKVLWGPVSQLLEDRRKRIADGLAAAEKGQHELRHAEERAKEVLREAKDRAAEIVAQAERRGAEIVEEAKANARQEAERILAAAQAEIDQAAQRAREELRAQVVQLAVAGAERVLRREIDPKAHQDLLQDLVAQL